jgi:hypothetical protein
MKKLTLNKKTIANLENPNKIYGGEAPRPTTNNTLCAEPEPDTGYATNGNAQCATENGRSWCYCACNAAPAY